MRKDFSLLLGSVLAFSINACRSDDDGNGQSANIPLLSQGTGNDSLSQVETSLVGSPIEDLAARFLRKDGGPANIPKFLTEIDIIIAQVNYGSFAVDRACETAVPTSYPIHPGGGTVEMFAQCYQNLYLGPTALKSDFNQYATKDGTNYIYAMRKGDQFAAIISPVANHPREHELKGFYTIGGRNSPSWSSAPYGLAQVMIDTATNRLELGVSGIGLGYCSAQIKSNGQEIFASYSAENGEDCGEHTEVCTDAKSGQVLAVCPDDVRAFDLPLLSREPAVANVTFNGTLNDSTTFGPVLPLPGIGGL